MTNLVRCHTVRIYCTIKNINNRFLSLHYREYLTIFTHRKHYRKQDRSESSSACVASKYPSFWYIPQLYH